MKRREISLSTQERQDLEALSRKGSAPARQVQRAKMLSWARRHPVGPARS